MSDVHNATGFEVLQVPTMRTNTRWRHEEVLFGSVFTRRSPHTWKKSIMIDPWLNITLRNCTFSAMRINLHSEPDARRTYKATNDYDDFHSSFSAGLFLFLTGYTRLIHHCCFKPLAKPSTRTMHPS